MIGPLDSDRKKNTGKCTCITSYAVLGMCNKVQHYVHLLFALILNLVNQIIEMHSRSPNYFEKGSIMLIFRPLEVEGKGITGFIDWEPESIK